jgi:uncharacterized protein YjbJ (UPF0337 family)
MGNARRDPPFRSADVLKVRVGVQGRVRGAGGEGDGTGGRACRRKPVRASGAATVPDAPRSPLAARDRAASTAKEKAMNWDRVAGNWKQMTGKVKEQWGKLTDDDLTAIDGKQDQLVGRVQERYGIAKDEAERQVKEWSDRM